MSGYSQEHGECGWDGGRKQKKMENSDGNKEAEPHLLMSRRAGGGEVGGGEWGERCKC